MYKVYGQRNPATASQPPSSQSGSGGSDSNPTSSPRLGQSANYNPEPATRNAPRPAAAEFLLSCLTANREPPAVSRLPSADWSEVAALAADLYLTPLLYKRLKESGLHAHAPADVWERLRRAHFASAVRNASLWGNLRKVLRPLRSSGIRVIVLKGAHLAAAIYSEDADRPMTDVDILVSRADLSRAQAILRDAGVGQQPSEMTESRHRQRLHVAQFTLRELRLEIHWAITLPVGPVRVDMTGIWERACPAVVAGEEVLALSPEDLLLHLCLHVCYQHFLEEGLRSFCDIAETVRHFRDDLDWAQVAIRARGWGAARHVGLALHLARVMLRADVPDCVLEQLVPGGIDPRILGAARESVLARTGFSQSIPPFDLHGAKSLGDKVTVLRHLVFLTREEMAARYPASRGSRYLFRYYLLRLRDLIRKYLSHTISHGRDPNAALVNWLSGKN